MRTTVKLKKDIIAEFENNVCLSDLAMQYNMTTCSISTFPENKIAMNAADVGNGSTTVHSKQRPQIMDKVEKLPLILIKEKELAGHSISEGMICEMAFKPTMMSYRKHPV